MDSKNKLIKRIYREKEINRVNKKINMLNNYPIDEIDFLNIRLVTTLIIVVIVLLKVKSGYIFAPIIALVYYYSFEYIFLDSFIIKRTKKL